LPSDDSHNSDGSNHSSNDDASSNDTIDECLGVPDGWPTFSLLSIRLRGRLSGYPPPCACRPSARAPLPVWGARPWTRDVQESSRPLGCGSRIVPMPVPRLGLALDRTRSTHAAQHEVRHLQSPTATSSRKNKSTRASTAPRNSHDRDATVVARQARGAPAQNRWVDAERESSRTPGRRSTVLGAT